MSPRRTRIPDSPKMPTETFKIIYKSLRYKNDLTKMSLPVGFSEPLSILQRITEDFQYSQVLDKAAQCGDPFERMAYVAAFAVSTYGMTDSRMSKPFSALLGETFEMDRSQDFGWKVVCEQVSIDPPITAQYCEGRGWRCWQDFQIEVKLKMINTAIESKPINLSHVIFDDSADHYVWDRATTEVNIRNMSAEHSGEVVIMNQKTADECRLKFRKDRSVTGTVKDKEGQVKMAVNGVWDDHVRASLLGEDNSDLLLWKVHSPTPESKSYYNFSEFACQLNEDEDGVAPTDTRKRPDIRFLEEGQWKEAAKVKEQLKENQQTSKLDEGYKPVWFDAHKDSLTGKIVYRYNDKYWQCKSEQDWSQCPVNLYEIN